MIVNATSSSRPPVRIIHLEDNLQDRELVSAMLSAADIKCDIIHADDHRTFETALTGVDAQLIISDFTMPGYTGVRALQLAQQLRESAAELRHPLRAFLWRA